MKTTVKDINLKDKKVLLRVDFNVPLDENLQVTDDTRIVEELPTIKYILDQGAKLIICSHLGRPKGKELKFSLKPAATRLSELLNKPVKLSSDVVGKDSVSKAKALKSGEILMLENLRFEPGEEKNDPAFCKKLASLAEVYVNDAFGTAHRKHASTYGVAKLLPNAVGFLMGKEITTILGALNNPDRPFVAIMGGSKISDKIKIVDSLLDKVDTILIGGGMSYTFVKALGGKIGKSICDDSNIELAKHLMEKAKANNVNFILPVDSGCGLEFKNDEKRKEFETFNIPENYSGYDIGKKSVKLFKRALKGAKTVIWNGTLGVSEFDNFAHGTKQIAKAVAKCKGTTIIGGGDSAAAIVKFGYKDKVTHVSTGGGASLQLIEMGTLPGIEVINDLK